MNFHSLKKEILVHKLNSDENKEIKLKIYFNDCD